MDILMPRLSDSMEEGTIVSWLKKTGEQVTAGEELVEIETDKATMVYESEGSGELLEIVADEGETISIGELIARIGDRGGGDASGHRAAEASPQAASDSSAGRPVDDSPAPNGPNSPRDLGADGRDSRRPRTKASPVARRVAREHDIELSDIEGSGPGGRVVKADLAAVLAEGGPTKSPREHPTASPKGDVERSSLTPSQRTAARRMAESKASAPHFYLETSIDVSALMDARADLKATGGRGETVPSVNDFIVKAAAGALLDHPRVNGAFVDDGFEEYARVNVGVAVSAEAALVVPTIYDADRKDLHQIAAETRELAEKARDGRITPEELSGGTFTVSNLGMFGITRFSPILYPPQAAILAVGAIESVPTLDDGQLDNTHRLAVTLACDHRILYGADGARFLARLRELLETPSQLVP